MAKAILSAPKPGAVIGIPVSVSKAPPAPAAVIAALEPVAVVTAPKAAIAVPVPVAKAKAPHDGPFHQPGVVVEIVGMEMGNKGCSCEEHVNNDGKVMAKDVVVRLRKEQIMVEGKEETAIAAIWVTDRIDRCRVGFIPRHMVKHTTRYAGVLVQVTCVLSADPTCCNSAERRLFFFNKEFCLVLIISCMSV